MRTTLVIAALALAVLLAGCVPSLHPLFTEKDLVYDPVLVGTWAKEEGEDRWAFQKSGDSAYELIYTEKGVPAQFETHLVQVGEFLFLDTYPKEPDIENGFYMVHLIPAHTFSRVWIQEDALRLAMLDLEWLKKMIAAKEVDVAHERVDEGIILTASTEELQKFVLKCAEDGKAFPDTIDLHRQK
jgi:hypothetical protein